MGYSRYILKNAFSQFRQKYTTSLLGGWWVVLEPIFFITIYSVVFTELMSAKIEGIESSFSYTLYLCIGLLPWLVFSESITTGSASVVSNAPYISKLPVPLYVYVLKDVLTVSFDIVIYLGLFFIFAYFVGLGASWYWGLVIIPVLLLQVTASGISLLLSPVNVFFRDVSHFMPMVMQLLMWALPIIYPMGIIPERFLPFVINNPLYYYIDAIRELFLYGRMPSLQHWAIMAATTVVVMAAGLFWTGRKTDEVKDAL